MRREAGDSGRLGVAKAGLLAALLLGCSHTNLSKVESGLARYNVEVLERSDDGVTVSLMGWFIQTGEFRLYARRTDIGELRNSACISGLFLDDAVREEAADYQARRVRIVGNVGLSVAQFNAEPIGTSPIQNLCGGEFVIFGRSIAVMD